LRVGTATTSAQNVRVHVARLTAHGLGGRRTDWFGRRRIRAIKVNLVRRLGGNMFMW
jgi:hypothetical protein